MTPTSVDFFLAPDGSSARRVRKQLAETAPGLYRMAGTWPELLAQAEACYLMPPVPDDWSPKLMPAASGLKDAFWSSSLKVASRETIAELDASLLRLLEATRSDPDWRTLLGNMPVESRLYKRLADISQLMECIGGLPEPIQRIANLVADSEPPFRAIRVYYRKDTMDLNIWQIALLNKLEHDAPPPDADLQDLIATSLTPPTTLNPTLLAARNLFSEEVAPPTGDVDGLRVIAVRDSLAEAEITAGFIQKALENGCRLCDMGLLLPEDPLSLMAIENVFQRCGLPLSGFNRPIGRRDLGREIIRAFLLCLRKPAPIMAIATLLTSPLMPWSADEGQAMAQAVMRGDVLLKSNKIPSTARRVMDLLDDGVTMPSDLSRALKRIIKLISPGDDLHDHLQRARETVDHLQDALTGMVDLDWERLLYLTSPESLQAVHPPDYWQDGIAVFHEGSLPWCAVRHLFVLGFNDGHFPAGAGASAVFTESEWEQIDAAGWPVSTNDSIRKRQRRLLADQLAAATESLTITFARRDAGGQALEPSSSLVFVARSLGVASDDLVLDLDRSKDLRRIPDLPLAESAPPSPPRELPATDIELGVDLLEVFSRKDGGLAPLSPSAAETLMVSPLAWLLRRLDCEPREWGTDDFDVLTAGTLAHSVFEALFQAGRPLPEEDEIAARVPKILQERVRQIAPFLRSADWRVERYKFESEVLRAALHWKKLLASCKAIVIAAEQWLRGAYGAVPLHGQSDLLVQIPCGRLLVVDYKKSSSGKRRERMLKGFDLQAHLYRLMIQTGGLPGFESPPDDIGIVYYLLNDTTALADGPVAADGSLPGWEMPANDISSQAMQHLDRRLAQIRNGTVKLNTTADEDWWSKNASLPIYALENSPLLRLFMRVEEVVS